MSMAKRLRSQYSSNYLQDGFIPAPTSELQPMCLLRNKVFSNEAMKPSTLSKHLKNIYPDKVSKSAKFFYHYRTISKKKKKLLARCFHTHPRRVMMNYFASCNFFLMIARKGSFRRSAKN